VERKARRKRAAALLADALVVGVAISLPWSTSATAILITLWFLSLLLLVGDATALRQALMLPAGALPVLLWLLGAAGMLWANVSWSERLAGLSGFHKLLFIPVLIAQFRHIGHGRWAILGLLASSAILLITSWALALLPGLTWRGKEVVGVPVKDYVFQSELFAICAYGAHIGLLRFCLFLVPRCSLAISSMWKALAPPWLLWRCWRVSSGSGNSGGKAHLVPASSSLQYPVRHG
jgi:O-antigen ligase